jgi:copper homeostasis protein
MTLASSRALIEVCVDSVASARAAERGGAGRLELCSALVEGGISPSAGLIETTKAAVRVPLHVMIRPRGGDFCYDPHEFDAMKRDIELVKRFGADGVVFGILDLNGQIDARRTQELLDLSRPLSVTFHRAFDVTADLFRALEDLCNLGIDRVLTSGGYRTCLLGREKIADLIKKADRRIVVMPGGGIKPENARNLVERTGAREIHVGLRSVLPSPMAYRNYNVIMGSAEDEYQRFGVLEEDVRRLREALRPGSH